MPAPWPPAVMSFAEHAEPVSSIRTARGQRSAQQRTSAALSIYWPTAYGIGHQRRSHRSAPFEVRAGHGPVDT